MLSQEEQDEVRREALLRVVAIVQRYHNENSRRLRVADICTQIKRLIKEEADGKRSHVTKPPAGEGFNPPARG